MKTEKIKVFFNSYLFLIANWKHLFVCYKDQPTTELFNFLTVVLLSYPLKIWGKLVQGFLSYDRTSIQTTYISTLYVY